MNVSIPAWLYYDKHFSSDYIDEIVNYCDNNLNLKDAKIGPTDETEKHDSGVRSTQIAFMQNDNPFENKLFKELNEFVHSVNNRFFKFDINKLNEIQYTVYNTDDIEDFYTWHVDSWHGTNQLPTDRKLSLTIQLTDGSEYEGCNFNTDDSFEAIPSELIRNKGSVIIFPSYIRHMVSPIKSGTRKVLVCWVEGPNWK